MSENEVSKHVVEAALAVHRELGPGLLESVYEHCIALELRKAGIRCEQQVALPVMYKEERLEFGFRMDLVVEDVVVVEVKATEAVHEVHFAQLLTYLKLSGKRLGLLINFNEVLLKRGVRRVVNGLPEEVRP
ncbi:MAG TPA: GxxExxY protein [Flavobacteriales bacterium]|nr:GxxExxY protein [Flavobacteriales bacterium]